MCKIDTEIFDTQSPAPLFRGKQQHWVLAFPDSGLDDATRVLFFRNRYLSDLGIHPDDIKITGRQIGRPSDIRGKRKARIASHIAIQPENWLPPDTIYISIAFDLEGGPNTIDWPWDYEGCPNELTSAGGLYSVYAPAQIVRVPKPDPLGETIDDITDDAGEAVETIKDSAEATAKAAALPVGMGLVGGLVLWLLLRK